MSGNFQPGDRVLFGILKGIVLAEDEALSQWLCIGRSLASFPRQPGQVYISVTIGGKWMVLAVDAEQVELDANRP